MLQNWLKELALSTWKIGATSRDGETAMRCSAVGSLAGETSSTNAEQSLSHKEKE